MKLAIIITVAFSVLQARSIQLKAVVISERVLGFDHPNTILQYVSSAAHVSSIKINSNSCVHYCSVLSVSIECAIIQVCKV